MTEESKQAAAAVPEVVQSAALAPSRSGVLPALPDDIADADVPALLADIERRVEALPGAFDAALARQQVVAVNAVAVAMQARNLRRVTDRALALIEARLAVLMPANPPAVPRGRPGNLTVNWQVPMPEHPTARPRRRGPPRRPAGRRRRPGNLTVNWQVSMPDNPTACHSRRRAPCATSGPRTRTRPTSRRCESAWTGSRTAASVFPVVR